MDLSGISAEQFGFVSNAFSFTIAVMGAALTISGIVTAIALYHYFRIFESWNGTFTVSDGVIATTGKGFNDAYRYVDWLLTVPLLLLELILVMRLTRGETISKGVRLGAAAALMIVLGYPGEVAADNTVRLIFWVIAMVPFLYIVYELFVGLRESLARQPEDVHGLVNGARWLTVAVWAFYPIVFLFPIVGLTGGTAVMAVQIGYTVADILAKAVFGVLIYIIAVRKSELEAETGAKRVVATA